RQHPDAVVQGLHLLEADRFLVAAVHPVEGPRPPVPRSSVRTCSCIYRDVMNGGSGEGRSPVLLSPGAGRPYAMGGMSAVFKADGDDTGGRYNVSEWWLDPHTLGPGAHSHDEDDIFYVIEGVIDFLVNDQWHEARGGSFVLVPGGVTHTFKNSSEQQAGSVNLRVPG